MESWTTCASPLRAQPPSKSCAWPTRETTRGERRRARRLGRLARRRRGPRAAVRVDRRGAARARPARARCAGSPRSSAPAFPARSARSIAPGCGWPRSADASRPRSPPAPSSSASGPRRTASSCPRPIPRSRATSPRRRAAGLDLNVNLLGEAILGDDEADARLVAVCDRLRRPDVRVRVGEDLRAVREPRRARVRPLGRAHRRAAARRVPRRDGAQLRRSSSISTWRSTATST